MEKNNSKTSSGFKRILVNPAFHVSESLKKNSGRKLPFFSKRQDGTIEFEVTPELINSFEKMENRQFENSSDPDNVTALFGNMDTTVNCKEEYLKHYQDFKDFDGEHRLTEEIVDKIIAPLIKEKLKLFN